MGTIEWARLGLCAHGALVVFSTQAGHIKGMVKLPVQAGEGKAAAQMSRTHKKSCATAPRSVTGRVLRLVLLLCLDRLNDKGCACQMRFNGSASCRCAAPDVPVWYGMCTRCSTKAFPYTLSTHEAYAMPKLSSQTLTHQTQATHCTSFPDQAIPTHHDSPAPVLPEIHPTVQYRGTLAATPLFLSPHQSSAQDYSSCRPTALQP